MTRAGGWCGYPKHKGGLPLKFSLPIPVQVASGQASWPIDA